MSTKVSIIIPVYNAEGTLERAIQSILRQTLQEFQLILVDDGSSDQSSKICDAYEQNDSRITVIHQANSGPGSARNRGLEIANGKYLAFLDADDYIEPKAYETMVHIAETEKTQLVMCGYRREFIRNGKVYSHQDIKTSNGIIEGIKQIKENFNELYLKNYFHLLWNKIYVLQIIKENYITFPEDIQNGEDLLFNLKYFILIKRIAICNHLFCHYTEKTGDSLTHKYDPNFFTNKVLLFEHIHVFVTEHLKCNENDMADYDVYLKDCFQSAENYLKNKSLLESRNKIKEILNYKYTKKALLTTGCGKIEYKIYRFILSLHSPLTFAFFCKLRYLFKMLLRGEEL